MVCCVGWVVLCLDLGNPASPIISPDISKSTEQEHDQQHDYDQCHGTDAGVKSIPSAAAEDKQQDEDYEDEGHGLGGPFMKRVCIRVVFHCAVRVQGTDVIGSIE